MDSQKVNHEDDSTIQWNLSILNTLGTAESVLIKGHVLISGVVLYISI